MTCSERKKLGVRTCARHEHSSRKIRAPVFSVSANQDKLCNRNYTNYRQNRPDLRWSPHFAQPIASEQEKNAAGSPRAPSFPAASKHRCLSPRHRCQATIGWSRWLSNFSVGDRAANCGPGNYDNFPHNRVLRSPLG